MSCGESHTACICRRPVMKGCWTDVPARGSQLDGASRHKVHQSSIRTAVTSSLLPRRDSSSRCCEPATHVVTTSVVNPLTALSHSLRGV